QMPQALVRRRLQAQARLLLRARAWRPRTWRMAWRELWTCPQSRDFSVPLHGVPRPLRTAFVDPGTTMLTGFDAFIPRPAAVPAAACRSARTWPAFRTGISAPYCGRPTRYRARQLRRRR